MRYIFHRLFFAIKPDAQALPQIAEQRRSHPIDRPVRDEHAHVTMGIFDDHTQPPQGLIDTLLAVGDALEGSEFPLSLNRTVGTTRSIALRPGRTCAGLARLHQAIESGVRHAGLAMRRGWGFSPHLTLGYRDGPAFARATQPILWPVRELVLVHSFVGATHHEIVRTWRLAPDGDPQLSLF